MARTRSHKLLLDANMPGQSLFFDLRADPYELRNLLGSSEAQEEIERLSAAIAAWRPQEMPNRYVDPQAPQIQGPNVPPPGMEHRQPIIDYYRAKMRELQERQRDVESSGETAMHRQHRLAGMAEHPSAVP